MELMLTFLRVHLGVNYAKLMTTLLVQNIMICNPNAKCGGHKVENYGIRCSFCNGLRHSEDCCWKKKDTKSSNSIANYLEVLINDEEATLTKLNMICGVNHHLSYGNKIPKKRLLMQAHEVEGIVKQIKGVEVRNKMLQP